MESRKYENGEWRYCMAYVDGLEFASGPVTKTLSALNHGALAMMATMGRKITIRLDTGPAETLCFMGPELSVETFRAWYHGVERRSMELKGEAFARGGMRGYNEARGYDTTAPEDCGHHCGWDCPQCGGAR
jgi:hypothetical protein